MYGHPNHRKDMSGFEPPVIELVATPALSWRNEDSKGVCASGWNPFKGLVVTLNDESTIASRVSITIEPPAPGTGICCMMFCVPFFPFFWPIMCPQLAIRANAHAYIFVQNAAGSIDLLHRRKPFFGSEIRTTYNDCTHFRAVVTQFRESSPHIHDESISQSSFILTYQNMEIKLPTGENFSATSLEKLNEIADVVNSLITISMERRQDLNFNLQPAVDVTDMPVADGYYITADTISGNVQPPIAVANVHLRHTADCTPLEDNVRKAVLYEVIDRD